MRRYKLTEPVSLWVSFILGALLLTGCTAGESHVSVGESSTGGNTVTLRYKKMSQSDDNGGWVAEFAGVPWNQWAHVYIHEPETDSESSAAASDEDIGRPEVQYFEDGRFNWAYLSDSIDPQALKPLETVSMVADEQAAFDEGLVERSALGTEIGEDDADLPPGNAPEPWNENVERVDEIGVERPDKNVGSPNLLFSAVSTMNLASTHADSYFPFDDRVEEWLPEQVYEGMDRNRVADSLDVEEEDLVLHASAERRSCRRDNPRGGGEKCWFMVNLVHADANVPLEVYINDNSGRSKWLRVTHVRIENGG